MTWKGKGQRLRRRGVYEGRERKAKPALSRHAVQGVPAPAKLSASSGTTADATKSRKTAQLSPAQIPEQLNDCCFSHCVVGGLFTTEIEPKQQSHCLEQKN